MKSSSILWFLRPTVGVLLCFWVAIAAAYLMSNQGTSSLDEQISVVADFAGDLGELRKPSPDLTPKEVVEIQVSVENCWMTDGVFPLASDTTFEADEI